MGGRIGFRYSDQVFNHFNDFLAGDEDHFVVQGYTGLVGILGPSHSRFAIEFQCGTYQLRQRHCSYLSAQRVAVPVPDDLHAATVGSIGAGRSTFFRLPTRTHLTNYVGHNQNYGLTASLTPRERFGLDLAYNYNSVIQNALICFNDTPPAGVSLPFVSNAGSCAANDPANPLLGNSYYTNHTHFGMTTVRFSPAKTIDGQPGLQHHQR